MEKLLLDVKEVASVLGCGRTHVYGMIQRGELPAVKLGRLTRVRTVSLLAFVEQQESPDHSGSRSPVSWHRS